MINYTTATNGKTTKTFKNPTSTRSQFNILKFLSAFALVMLLGVNGVMGQTTIASQDFEASPATPTMTYSVSGSGGTAAVSSGQSGASGSNAPATTDLFSEGARGYRVANSVRTITFSSVNTSSYTSVSFSIRLASFSIGSSGNGSDAGDFARVQISPDNGTTWYTRVNVNGDLNARWSFSSGTGNATNTYAANNTSTNYAPSSGGARTTDGYSTITISSLPQVSQLAVRIVLTNDDGNESWLIDDVRVRGTVAAPTLTATTSPRNVDNSNFTVTYPSDASFNTAIGTGSITMNNGSTTNTLTANTDYTLANGTITFNIGSSSNAFLKTVGTYTISVNATGYTAATVSQQLTVGVVNKLGVTIQPTAPLSNGAVLATQPVVAIQDQYGNTITTDNSTIVTAAVSTGSWTIGGTTSRTAVSGLATFTNLTATGVAAVASATIGFTSSPVYTSTTSSPAFAIPSPPPANDDCNGAVSLTIDAVATSGTSLNASQTLAAITCNSSTSTGTLADVWYSFQATSTSHSVNVVPGASYDAVVEVLTGACNGTNLNCADGFSAGSTENVILTGLTIGQVYLIRVYHFGGGSSATPTFTINVSNALPYTWDGSSSASWLTNANWANNTFPNGSNHLAYFNVTTQTANSINMSIVSGALSLGALQYGSGSSSARTLTATGTTATGVITLSGLTLNTIPNTIIWNQSAATTPITFNPGTGLSIALGNNTTNAVNNDATGNIVVTTAISGTSKSLTYNSTSSGDLRLSGTNTFNGGFTADGTSLGTGKLRFDATAAFPISGNIAVTNYGRLSFNVAGTYGNSGQTMTFTPTQTTTGSLENAASNIATVFPGSVVFTNDTRIEPAGASGSITLSGNATGAGTLVKAAAGTLVLSGTSNNLTGGITLGNGTLTVNSGSSMGTGALLMSQTAGNNTALNLNENQTVSSLSSAFADASGTRSQVITIVSNKTLTINQSTNTTYGTGAVSTLTSTLAGTSGSIVKSGNGTLTLSSANGYTGSTTISGGTLQAGIINFISASSPVILNGGTLRSGATAGFAQSLNTLQLTDNSTLYLGTGNHTVSFAASNGISWTSGKTLTIYGWVGGYDGSGASGSNPKLYVGTTVNGLSATQLDQIVFNNGVTNYAATILSDGQVVPTTFSLSFYYQTGGVNGMNNVSNWTTGAGGTGNSPANFSDDNQTFNIISTETTANNSSTFTVSGAGSKILFGNAGYGSRTLTISSGKPIVGNMDITVAGSGNGNTLVISDATSPTLGTLASTASVTYSATEDQSIAAKTFKNLTLGGSGIKTLSGSTVVTATLTVPSGVTLDFGSNVVSGTGDVDVQSGATVITANTSGLNGSNTTSGGLSSYSTSASYSFNGGSSQVFGAALPATVNNLTINNGNTNLSLGALRTINGALTITSGKLAIGAGNTLTLNGGLTCDANNSLISTATSNITLTGATKTLYFDASNNSLRNLAITGSNTMTLGNALNITGGSTFGVVTVGTGATLATGGNLTLRSDANGTASIGTSLGTVSGSVTAERYVSGAGRRWRFLSSPVQSATVANWMSQFYVTGPGDGVTLGVAMTTGWHASQANIDFPNSTFGSDVRSVKTTSIRTYNESASGNNTNLNAGWANLTGTNQALTPGQGFRTFIRGPIGNTGQLSGAVAGQTEVTLSLSGTVNQGDVSPTLTNNTQGWNLLGNPYPCGYNLKAQYDAAQTSNLNNIDANYYVFDPNTNGYKGYNPAASSGAGAGTLTSGIIPSGTAFFVQATGTPTFIFKETFKTNSAPIALHKKASNSEFSIKYFKDSAESDEFIISMMEGATLNKDRFDINKLRNENLNLSSFGIDTLQLMLSSIPQVIAETRLKLNVEATIIGTYNFDFKNMDNFQSNITVHLFDRYTNKTTDVRKNTKYTFQMGAGENQWGKNRFELILNLNKTGVDEFALLNKTQMLVYPNPATDVLNINISNSSFKNSEVVVYNISGTEVIKTNMANNNAQLNIETLSNGVYFVKVTNQNGFNKTVKFVK